MSSDLAFVWVTKTDQEVQLKCSCKVEMWKLLLVTAGQIRHGVPVVCPEHKQDHEFSTCTVFRDIALKFKAKFFSEDGISNFE